MPLPSFSVHDQETFRMKIGVSINLLNGCKVPDHYLNVHPISHVFCIFNYQGPSFSVCYSKLFTSSMILQSLTLFMIILFILSASFIIFYLWISHKMTRWTACDVCLDSFDNVQFVPALSLFVAKLSWMPAQ